MNLRELEPLSVTAKDLNYHFKTLPGTFSVQVRILHNFYKQAHLLFFDINGRKKGCKKIIESKTAKSKAKTKSKNEDFDDGLAIIDDDLSVDQEKINEERRAYLEEAKSQEASD